MTARIVVLISGQGRNLQALLDACADGRIDGRIAAVVSNRADAGGLQRARDAGVVTRVLTSQDYADRASYDAALAEVVDIYAPDIVVLAGFMRILTPGFVQRYSGRMINIHPSLLPRHTGLHTHQRALDAGDAEHGATVHFVTEELDGGPAIVQGKFMVQAQDTQETLAERVMQQIELKIFPQAVAWLAAGDVALVDGKVRFRDRVLDAPLSMDAVEGRFR
ncbi:phosphoribosylglycinamide formyltransferase [Sinimarinibacterium sp. CAU 1509]|uniref:phosphoribosylglycinamide formyltransferase n=1 Tax=Sinimarinibacterium sp. CAU 1509 TaxID=2562283 RepID=UPI0010AB61ED|nr:phosphoribosylglycinamide formyltransferase [Sinimarinibacterium sp. CAU 1509]TJY61887.1 phosphoribosylglycinamide formyltransferase [Sinimarinibacterium sp. CAU 1509]